MRVRLTGTMQDMDIAQVYEEFSARNRLEELGLEEARLLAIVREGHAYRVQATANHPPTHGGLMAYGNMVRALRDWLVPQGWERVNDHNFCTIINRKTGIALAVTSGDEDTGLVESVVGSRRSKGRKTLAAVAQNVRQITLFDEFSEIFGTDISVLPIDYSELRTYYLLTYPARGDKELRAELSLPVTVDDRGYLDGWAERIILPATSIDDEEEYILPDDGPTQPEPEVKIKRRA